jgi:hypothetical protein
MALSSKFLTELVERLPEADRGTVLSALDKPEAAEAVKFAEEGAKRQSDYSRTMDEARSALAAKQRDLDTLATDVKAQQAQTAAWHEELAAWHASNKAALDAGWKALGKKPGNGDDAGDPAARPDLPPDVVRRADMDKYITEREMGAARYMHTVIPLALTHMKEFGEVLDFEALMRDPKLKDLGLLGVYEASVAERRKAAAVKAEDARVNAKVEERLAAERKRGIPPPYPVSSMDVSPLDALKPADAAPGVVDDAVSLYDDLVRKRLTADRPAG